MTDRIQQLIQHLGLLPHPEGGFYAETYRSLEIISQTHLPNRFQGDRSFGTAIYFLVPAGQFSAFHRIESDEVWHFYEGVPLEVLVIKKDGDLQTIRLGKDIENGELFQAVVPAGSWFASKPIGDVGYALVGCPVAPGFDFEGFELADRMALLASYPQHETVILSLTR